MDIRFFAGQFLSEMCYYSVHGIRKYPQGIVIVYHQKGVLMKKYSIYAVIAGLIFLFSSSVDAGVYSDDLSRCLVESSTSSDKLMLVKWMFTSMSLHPAVKSMASVSAKQLADSSKETADMIVNLVTKTCRDQAKKAIKYEGGVALQSSFSVFGQVAAKELFSHPDVAAGLAGLEKYLSAKKIKEALEITE